MRGFFFQWTVGPEGFRGEGAGASPRDLRHSSGETNVGGTWSRLTVAARGAGPALARGT